MPKPILYALIACLLATFMLTCYVVSTVESAPIVIAPSLE